MNENLNKNVDKDVSGNAERGVCPCCPNHCQEDSLQCGKGRRYFTQGDRDKDPAEGNGGAYGGKESRCEEDLSLEGKILRQLRRCFHYFRYGMGGNTSQQRILSMLGERGVITQRELQDMLGVQSGSLSEILGKVESSGYIMRRQNENDRRQMNLELTKAGRNAAHSFREEHVSKAKEMFHGLTEEEKEQLSVLLEKMMANWPQMEAMGKPGRGCHGGQGRRGGREAGDGREGRGRRGGRRTGENQAEGRFRHNE